MFHQQGFQLPAPHHLKIKTQQVFISPEIKSARKKINHSTFQMCQQSRNKSGNIVKTCRGEAIVATEATHV